MKVDLERELARLILHCARGCTVHCGSGVGVAPGHCALVTLSYSTEAIIRRPLEDVFDFCSDLRYELTWNPNASSVTKPTNALVGVGTRYSPQWSGRGPTTVDDVRFERPRMWESRFSASEGDARANPEARLMPPHPARGTSRAWRSSRTDLPASTLPLGRTAVFPNPDWAMITSRLALLAALAIACSLLATARSARSALRLTRLNRGPGTNLGPTARIRGTGPATIVPRTCGRQTFRVAFELRPPGARGREDAGCRRPRCPQSAEERTRLGRWTREDVASLIGLRVGQL